MNPRLLPRKSGPARVSSALVLGLVGALAACTAEKNADPTSVDAGKSPPNESTLGHQPDEGDSGKPGDSPAPNSDNPTPTATPNADSRDATDTDSSPD